MEPVGEHVPAQVDVPMDKPAVGGAGGSVTALADIEPALGGTLLPVKPAHSMFPFRSKSKRPVGPTCSRGCISTS